MRLDKGQTRWNSCCFYCHLASVQVPLLSLNSGRDHHCYECIASAEMDIHVRVSPSKTSICVFFYVALWVVASSKIEECLLIAHKIQPCAFRCSGVLGCSSLCYLHQIFSPGLSEAYKFQSWAKKEVSGESDMSAVHTERLGTGNVHLPPPRHSHTSHHCADRGCFFPPFFAPPSYSSPHLPRGTNEAADSALWHAAKIFLASFSSICSPLLWLISTPLPFRLAHSSRRSVGFRDDAGEMLNY